MKAILGTLGVSLALYAGQGWAQAGELYDAVVTDNTSIADPAKAIEKAESQWLAFSIQVA